jgi:hypothetical protein
MTDELRNFSTPPSLTNLTGCAQNILDTISNFLIVILIFSIKTQAENSS